MLDVAVTFAFAILFNPEIAIMPSGVTSIFIICCLVSVLNTSS